MVYPADSIMWVNTQYFGISDIKTENNNLIILYTKEDVFNRWFCIRKGIGEVFNGRVGQKFELLSIIVYLDNSLWVNTKYYWIDDTPTKINNLIMRYTIGDVFNGW